jgi:hypothetical protein
MPEPPIRIAADSLALTAWRNVYNATVMREGEWCGLYDTSLEVLAMLCSEHCRRWCGYVSEHPDYPVELARTRLMARQWMAKFLLIPERLVPFGTLREDGLDRDIARLCGL